MKKLISMTDFVLSDEWDGLDESNFIMIIEYAKFLKQPLELWMFVPCDENGNVLEEPKKPHTCSSENAGEYWEKYYSEFDTYKQAKERCLFEGFHEFLGSVSNGKFELNTETFWFSDVQENGIVYGQAKTIEDLIGWDIELTQTTQKQLCLI